MDLLEVTPVILVHNEACNLRRTLSRLTWARRIVIVDSGSSDDTRQIASEAGTVLWLDRRFDNFAAQRNFGLSAVETPWALSLDADFELCQGFESEIVTLQPGANVSAYDASFDYVVFGTSLGSSLYPDRPVLILRSRCKYIEDGHCERLVVNGERSRLRTHIRHDDRKPLPSWFRSQIGYATLEARKLAIAPAPSLGLPDRIRKMAVLAPLLVPIYALFWKGLVLKGRAGWYYVLQRTLAEIILSLIILDEHLRKS